MSILEDLAKAIVGNKEIVSPLPKGGKGGRNIEPTITPPPDKGAVPYTSIINESAKKYDVPQEILYNLLKAESSFNPDVISGKTASPAGAQGIAQFMPTTAQGLGINPLNPDEAIPAAAKYLANNYKKYGNWESALAAYNAGSGNVDKYGGVPPFSETQNYVKKILKNYKQ